MLTNGYNEPCNLALIFKEEYVDLCETYITRTLFGLISGIIGYFSTVLYLSIGPRGN